MSKIVVLPGDEQNTHHVSFEDIFENRVGLILTNQRGKADPKAITRDPIDRLAMKQSTGNQKYDDMERPWSPVAQDDHSGGRGNEDFDVDVTRFWDAMNVSTAFGRMFLTGQPTYTTGYRNAYGNLPGSLKWQGLIDNSTPYIANKYTETASYNTRYVYLYVRRRGTPANPLTVEFCSTNSGVPGSVLKTMTITTTTINDIIAMNPRVDMTSQAVTSGTTYWVKAYSTGGTSTDHWEIGVKTGALTSKTSKDNTTWVNTTFDMYFRVTDTDTEFTAKKFQYRYCEYMYHNFDGAAPKLYINGDRGVADANTGALSTLVDATKAWVADEFVGCFVKIISGLGNAERTNYRLITANTPTALTVTPDWKITHDTTTEYVILGQNNWRELTGHGLTVPVTDYMIVNNILYMCQGDDVALRRYQCLQATGAFSETWAADSTNKACFLKSVRESGGLYVWRVNNKDATGDVSASRSDVKPWGTDLSFGTALTMKDQWGKANSAIEYDSKLWIIREGTVNACTGTTMEEVKLTELRTMAESTNGVAVLTHNVYLYFNLGAGLERYLNGSLDDVGANRDDGLPADRQGIVSALVGYPGRYFAAIDGGTSNYSSILMNNGTGWHDVYCAPIKGLRILSLDYQAIPGTALDRLWVQVGSDIIWLPFPSLTINPTKDSNYRFQHEGYFISGWIYCGMFDAYKLFNSLKLQAENLSDTVKIEADYQTNTETVWHPLSEAFIESPFQECKFSYPFGVNGKRMRFRLRPMTEDNTISPVIKATVVDSVSIVTIKFGYGMVYRTSGVDINGSDDLEEVQTQLDEWAEAFTPLVMRCGFKRYDNKQVYISAASLTPTEEIPDVEGNIVEVARLTAVEF
ncbi:MAG: hypothetical protein WC455_21820 [Dehalococcoidia bacterium]|jgi:hypothetical protein